MTQPVTSKYQGEILCVDKPLHWTSFDVVNKLRYALKRRTGEGKIKVGHAGTLDPLATGLLLICTGAKTKTIEQLTGLHKVYTGCITLGAQTSTYDMETVPQQLTSCSNLTKETVQKAMQAFNGKIQQRPPDFSAKKVGGKKSYELARKGLATGLRNAEIEIMQFELLQFDASAILPSGLDVQFSLRCSKGTYVRSLAHDLGMALGCGGFLSSLRREQIGDFHIRDAMQIDAAVAWLEGV